MIWDYLEKPAFSASQSANLAMTKPRQGAQMAVRSSGGPGWPGDDGDYDDVDEFNDFGRRFHDDDDPLQEGPNRAGREPNDEFGATFNGTQENFRWGTPREVPSRARRETPIRAAPKRAASPLAGSVRREGLAAHLLHRDEMGSDGDFTFAGLNSPRMHREEDPAMAGSVEVLGRLLSHLGGRSKIEIKSVGIPSWPLLMNIPKWNEDLQSNLTLAAPGVPPHLILL